MRIENTKIGVTLAFASARGMNRNGIFRGHILRAMLEDKLSEAVEHRIKGEVFSTDDFYNSDRASPFLLGMGFV